MISQQEIDHQLESFGEEFRLSLPERIVQIEQHWLRLQELKPTASTASASRSRGRRKAAGHARARAGSSTDHAQVVRELARALHSLAGSAPMFGFSVLGAAARRAEHGLTERGSPATADLMREVLEIMWEHLGEEVIVT